MQIVKNNSQTHCDKCNCVAEKGIASITYEEYDLNSEEYCRYYGITDCGYCKTCNTIWSVEKLFDSVNICELVFNDYETDAEIIERYDEGNGGDKSCENHIQEVLNNDDDYSLERHNELKAKGYLPIGFRYGNKGADDTVVYAKLPYLEELIANYKDWQNKNNV